MTTRVTLLQHRLDSAGGLRGSGQLAGRAATEGLRHCWDSVALDLGLLSHGREESRLDLQGNAASVRPLSCFSLSF